MLSSNIIKLEIPKKSLEEIITNLIAMRDLNLSTLKYLTENAAKDSIKKKILKLEKHIAVLDRSQFAIGDKVLNMGLIGTILEIYLETDSNINVQDRQLLYKIKWDEDCQPKFAGITNTYYIYNLVKINPQIKYYYLTDDLYPQHVSKLHSVV